MLPAFFEIIDDAKSHVNPTTPELIPTTFEIVASETKQAAILITPHNRPFHFKYSAIDFNETEYVTFQLNCEYLLIDK